MISNLAQSENDPNFCPINGSKYKRQTRLRVNTYQFFFGTFLYCVCTLSRSFISFIQPFKRILFIKNFGCKIKKKGEKQNKKKKIFNVRGAWNKRGKGEKRRFFLLREYFFLREMCLGQSKLLAHRRFLFISIDWYRNLFFPLLYLHIMIVNG